MEIYHRQEGFLEPERGIRCDFPASAKQGTIPLRILRLVNQKQAWIQVRGAEETTVRAGDYDVRVMAAGEGKSPEGYLFPRDFNWR
ncbi:hypothetical protein LVJ94_27700 [Pendulispora rubella]|uniref:Uncharacterized protein n=1 Tax=Pendulispora rubella TaxID=2741070 RepID=A0ABZ2KPV2_9BACT